MIEMNLEAGYDLQLYKEGGSRAVCCNSRFPDWNNGQPGGSSSSSLYWCEEDEDEEFMSCEDCAKLWSEYAHVEGEELLYQACEGYIPDQPASPAWAEGSIVGDNPHLEWGFIYSHKYQLQRKRGNGSWSTITTLDNCIVGKYLPG